MKNSSTPAGADAVPRRRFLRGLATGAAACTLPAAAARAATPLLPNAEPSALSGNTIDLVVAPVDHAVGNRRRAAPGVNGSIPGPVLRWREGDTVTVRVRNMLRTPTSIHWHGIRTPSGMDGVPGLSFAGIAPGESFTYRFPLRQSGTYWYHSHSGFQEQTGLYGALVVAPREPESRPPVREHVVLLSDWTDVSPEEIGRTLKMQSDYYNNRQRTVGTLFRDIGRIGLDATLHDRLAWGRMRMSPTDIADVNGTTYSYLVNGHGPDENWTGMFRPGEPLRLRFINASAMTLFDVRIPGLTMTVVQADGNAVEPVPVDEFRIGAAETYDVIVTPTEMRAYTIFAQSEDRSGYARGTLSPRAGLIAAIPAMDPRPIRTMADMGMGGMGGMDMGGMPAPETASPAAAAPMPGMDMAGMDMSPGAMPAMTASGAGDADAARLRGRPGVDNVASMPVNRLGEAGDGLDNNGRRVLRYTDLRALTPGTDPRPPSRDIVLHLTGNMHRYIWGFDGRTSSQAEPIRLGRGERVRFVLVNDTMMEHPVHLHGLWSELENGQGDRRPYKHTVIVKPGEKLSTLVTADEPGQWAFHCHLMYHMAFGMFRTVVVI